MFNDRRDDPYVDLVRALYGADGLRRPERPREAERSGAPAGAGSAADEPAPPGARWTIAPDATPGASLTPP